MKALNCKFWIFLQNPDKSEGHASATTSHRNITEVKATITSLFFNRCEGGQPLFLPTSFISSQDNQICNRSGTMNPKSRRTWWICPSNLRTFCTNWSQPLAKTCKLEMLKRIYNVSFMIWNKHCLYYVLSIGSTKDEILMTKK